MTDQIPRDEKGVIRFKDLPKPAGCYVIGDWRFAMKKKPNAFHRFMTKLLLGWEWIDND